MTRVLWVTEVPAQTLISFRSPTKLVSVQTKKGPGCRQRLQPKPKGRYPNARGSRLVVYRYFYIFYSILSTP